MGEQLINTSVVDNIMSSFDGLAINNWTVVLSLFYRLVIDGGLVVLLLLSTLIGGILVSNF